ncbi:hypothetical protein Vafri_11744 [Volvox africanus]|uniref:Protein kinase domain-containing protein n=1 Tax=Volvox africanus TaxID=51714 RepID=A0A8J4F3R1_9CHLO|nr:hypothetical protein Vafri_11744 [Volvox africanus]
MFGMDLTITNSMIAAAFIPRAMVKYEIKEEVGRGTFGTVKKVLNIKTNRYVAMKILGQGSDMMLVLRECLNHRRLGHPHIVRFREVIRRGPTPCIVMEYANGGNLYDWVKKQGPLGEIMARWFFQQLILAIQHCHERGIAHRDIKPQNLLLHIVEGVELPILKICDFGYSKDVSNSNAVGMVGTPGYVAPEVMESCGKKSYDAKVADVWSCGVVLHVMLCGLYSSGNQGEDQGISEAQKVRRMLDRMETEAYVLNPNLSVTEECIDMLCGMLKPAPEQRLTIEKIMEHPWFNTYLPEQAREMNMYYLNLPEPPESQHPDQIMKILHEASDTQRRYERTPSQY